MRQGGKGGGDVLNGKSGDHTAAQSKALQSAAVFGETGSCCRLIDSSRCVRLCAYVYCRTLYLFTAAVYGCNSDLMLTHHHE